MRQMTPVFRRVGTPCPPSGGVSTIFEQKRFGGHGVPTLRGIAE
jgi:hypothetical protein